jgi:cell fate (sporulation/competence/biofilm development) regulator YmcA (YheA/YmcA/DUF963 family)
MIKLLQSEIVTLKSSQVEKNSLLEQSSTSIEDLKKRLSQIVVAYNNKNEL